MNNLDILREISKKTGIPLAHHIGDPKCEKCHGIGYYNIPLWKKLKAHYIERLPWDCIVKMVCCNKCNGSLVWEVL